MTYKIGGQAAQIDYLLRKIAGDLLKVEKLSKYPRQTLIALIEQEVERYEHDTRSL